MSTDATVSSQDVLRAVLQVRRQGVVKALQELEPLEPNLAEFLLEETTTLHHLVFRLGCSAKQLRQIDQRVYTLVLVLVIALRKAHARLWQDDAEGASAEATDPSTATPTHPPLDPQ